MELKRIIFSVIMPCYNSEAYVANAMESITKQTYPHWQLVAINDGSTDGTLSILKQYAQKDKRIRVISKENGGYVSAVNVGLDYIAGDYFLFLGSDDRLSTELFENIYQSIQQLSYIPDLVAFRTQKVVNGITKGIDSFTSFKTASAMQDVSLKAYSDKYPTHAAIFSCRDTSKCFKTSLLQNLRYFGKYGLDADGIFSMMFCHNASSFLSVPYDGYLWTLRSDSVSATVSLEKSLDRLENWAKFFEVLSQRNIEEITSAERDYIDRYYSLTARFCNSLKNVIKYHSFIHKHAKNVRSLTIKYELQSMNVRKKLLAFSPFIFSLVHKIYSFWVN